MSGFIKRDATINPAGGVNPASSPNIGQYGWTSFDAKNVNQILEYVALCKEYAEAAQAAADYVASKVDTTGSYIRIDELHDLVKIQGEKIDRLKEVVDELVL
ncbi:MAG: hypothetical protein ACRC6V_02770 [Bacteroidales bacterium]